MNEPIKVGDLVCILHCCCDDEKVGAILQVESIQEIDLDCMDCGLRERTVCSIWHGVNRLWGRPLSWLKKIPPLDELEGEKRDEEIDREITA